MSIRVSTIVWERSALQGADLLLLLAIADQANDEGEAWPSLDTLQAKLRFATRQGLLNCIGRVVESGELTKTARVMPNGSQKTNMYRVEVGLLLSRGQRYFYTAAEREAAKRAQGGGSTPVDGGGLPQLTGGVYPSRPESSVKPEEQTKNKNTSTDVDPSADPIPQQPEDGNTPNSGDRPFGNDQTAGKGSRQDQAANTEDGPGAARAAFVDAWNMHRGTLPAVAKVSRDRAKAIDALIADLGEDALPMFIDAAKEVATLKFWKENRYGFDNLLRGKVTKYAEAWRDRAQVDDDSNPMNRRRYE